MRRYKSKETKIWEEIIRICNLTEGITKDEVNDIFHNFLKDINEDYGKSTINMLEKAKATRSGVSVEGNIKCFDFSENPTEDIDKLINEIKVYSNYLSEETRLNTKASKCKTLGDMYAFMREELLDKECSDLSSISYKIESLLNRVNRNIYTITSKNDKKDIYIFLNEGKSYRYGCNYDYVSFDNCFLFSVKVSRKIVGTHRNWDYTNSNVYAIKSIESDSDCFDATLKQKHYEWVDEMNKIKKSENDQATKFMDELKAHGFDALEDLFKFIKTATPDQQDIIKRGY